MKKSQNESSAPTGKTTEHARKPAWRSDGTAIEHEGIRRVLGKSGHIEVLYPEDLRRKVAEAAMKIWQRNFVPSISSEFSMKVKQWQKDAGKINKSG